MNGVGDEYVPVTKYRFAFVFFIFIVGVVSFRSIEKPLQNWAFHNDFAHYFITSDLLKNGVNPYVDKISDRYQNYDFTNKPTIDRATNPPALATLFAPFTALSAQNSFILWSIIQAISIPCMLILIFRMFEIKLQPFSFLIANIALFVAYPTVTHLEHGQVQLLLTLLITMGLFAIVANKQLKTGVFLWGIATSLKLFTWPLLIVSYGIVAMRGEAIKGVGWFLVGFLVLNIPALMIFGPQIFIDYITLSLPYIAQTTGMFNSSNSLMGAVTYTMTLLGFSNGEVGNAIKIQSIIYTLMLIATTFYLARIALRSHPRNANKNGDRKNPVTSNESSSSDNHGFRLVLIVCLTILFLLLFSPTTWAHYFVLTFIPLCVLCASTIKGVPGAPHPVNLIIAYVLIALTQGRIRTAGLEWELISSWFGVFALGYLIVSTVVVLRGK